jgi:rhodanese-related sulfurtransferase
LADRVSPSELKRTLMDLPGSVQVVDIRPSAHFADYHLPGSHNADIAQLLSSPAYLSGSSSLVIVDRDGSLAMMVAGILSQKTQRRVIALHGGLQAYWAESDLGSLIVPGTLPGSSTGSAFRPSPSSSSKPAASPVTKPRKRRSAGC